MKLLITNVDMYGYCGREHHPEKTDKGLTVIPLKMETNHMSMDSDWQEIFDGDEVNVKLAQDTECHVVCWICITEDGRLLELMDHEVEVVK